MLWQGFDAPPLHDELLLMAYAQGDQQSERIFRLVPRTPEAKCAMAAFGNSMAGPHPRYGSSLGMR